MENVSAVTLFIFTEYTELEDYRYLYSSCFLLVYIAILLVNSVLLLVICFEKSLHEPMYLFICNLAVNGVYGSTVILPSIVGHLVSQNYEISLTLCLLQMYNLYVYGIVEYITLAVMGYDRYLAICRPLHYHLLMTPRKVYSAIAFCWFIPCIHMMLYLTLSTAKLSFCNKLIEKVYCSTLHFQKQSCSDAVVEDLVGLALITLFPGLPIVLILISYAHILKVCLSASKESQIKAFQTCTPHLLAVINFSVGVLYELIQSPHNMSNVPHKAQIFLSLYFWIIPPLSNPVIYGISIQAIRVQTVKQFISKKNVNY